MPFALELALDDAAAAVVREVWHELAGAGFPFMAESGANPHVSLAIWETIDRAAAMEQALATFAEAVAPVDVRLSRIDTFATTGVLFLAPETDARLREAHARCHDLFAGVGAGAWPHYAPGVWAPHCTLAMDLDDPSLARAHAVAARVSLPLRGRLERAEVVEFHPVRRRAVAPLVGRP